MADAKISALTALAGSGVDGTADVMPIVDTDAGVTKKIVVNELAIALNSVPATQAQQETGTSTATTVTPGRQHYHLGHPKAVLILTDLGSSPYTITTLYNSLGSLTPTTNGTGDFTLAWTNTLTNPSIPSPGVELETTTRVRRFGFIRNGGLTGTSVRFQVHDEAGTAATPTALHVTIFGNLA